MESSLIFNKIVIIIIQSQQQRSDVTAQPKRIKSFIETLILPQYLKCSPVAEENVLTTVSAAIKKKKNIFLYVTKRRDLKIT
jgi:myo-inositol catabolism protein IolC